MIGQKNITYHQTLHHVPINKKMFIWLGDITTLAVDSIVNAANILMLVAMLFYSLTWMY